MIVVLAIDALEHALVSEFSCKNLSQNYFGKTDITEFSEPRTMVLWSSFMTGRNMEKEILSKGEKEMWNTRIPLQGTFFDGFERPLIIDLPGFSYEKGQHDLERQLLKQFFDATTDEEKGRIRKEYNAHAFEHHRNVKEEFKAALERGHDLLLGYFSIADVIGHLNFGNKTLMKMIYQDLDEIAGGIDTPYIVLSDHGMTPIGVFGDHSNYGFWSTDTVDLGTPRITDFAGIIKEMRGKKS